MTEITLEYGEAYLKDRLKELRNQVPFGDAWVFVGAFTLLNVLGNLSGRVRTEELLPTRYSKLSILSIYNNLRDLIQHFSMTGNLSITHETKLHLKKRGDRVCLAIEPFLNDVEIAITTLFTEAKTDSILAAKMFVSLNEHRLIMGEVGD